jgi:hypothetical protein
VIRLRVFLGAALALGAIAGTFVRAQSTEEKKSATSKAREEMRALSSPQPFVTPSPTAKPKPANRKSKAKKTPTPTPTPKAKSKATGTPEPTKTPKAKASPKTMEEEEEEGDPSETGETPEPSKTPGGKKSPAPAAGKSPAPKSKAKSKKSPTPEPDKSPSPKKKGGSPTPTPKAKPTETAEPATSASPASPPVKSPPAKPDGLKPSSSDAPVQPFRPTAEPTAVPRPAQRPSPRPPEPQTALPSDITIEKSGLEQDQGFEPPPPPPPRRRSWWPFSRRTANYRYLSAANIEAIRRAPVQRARWKFVIVHNSGTRQGSARVFDYYHKRVRRMKNGLAYHFVVGNGTSTRDGQIEIGDRWSRQARGGHVHSDYMNNIGLGICLVGDFNRHQPTRAQLEATEELIKYLQERCGSGRFSVRPHREVNPPRWATDCPGDVFPYGWFGRFR